MSSIWKYSRSDMIKLSDKINTKRIEIGDVTVVCHTSNQGHLLQRLIDSSRRITDKIIILDDCSEDHTIELALYNKCRVFKIPEGWIYTHGFGELLKFQQNICDSEYHLQLDTGEHLYVPDDAGKLTEDYYRTILVFKKKKGNKLKQANTNRLFKTRANITVKPYIHGGPEESKLNKPLADLLIFHGYEKDQKNKQSYIDRKNRLYFKLLKKGYEEKKLANDYWYKQYKNNKEDYNRIIKQLEEKIGILEETDENIKEIT